MMIMKQQLPSSILRSVTHPGAADICLLLLLLLLLLCVCVFVGVFLAGLLKTICPASVSRLVRVYVRKYYVMLAAEIVDRVEIGHFKK